MSLVFTQADLDGLKAALVTGALKVQVGDRSIEYRSQADLIAAIKTVQEYMDGVATDVDNNPNVIQAGFSRGGS